MDLRGEEDVIGRSSLPAVEQDTACRLLQRAARRTESHAVCVQEKASLITTNAPQSHFFSFNF